MTMADNTIWTVNGAEFALDLQDADTAERYDNALDTLRDSMPDKDGLKHSDYIRAYCKTFREFYDVLLGDGAAAKIFEGIKDNARTYTQTYADFLAFVAKQAATAQEEQQAIRRKYLPKSK